MSRQPREEVVLDGSRAHLGAIVIVRAARMGKPVVVPGLVDNKAQELAEVP
jgi:hypothetical protein